MAIKLSEKKEMLAATITDNDRIGPSLAVLCSIEQDGASLKIFMTAGIHILICSCATMDSFQVGKGHSRRDSNLSLES